MQFIVISHQLWEIFIASCLGLFLGAVYDGVRFVRRLLSPKGREAVIDNVLDILFFTFSGVCYCVLLYAVSNGRFRWFTALGLLFGYVLYCLLPSRLIRPVLFFAADKIKAVFGLLLLPFKKLIKIVCDVFRRTALSGKRKRQLIKTEKIKKELYKDVKLI